MTSLVELQPDYWNKFRTNYKIRLTMIEKFPDKNESHWLKLLCEKCIQITICFYTGLKRGLHNNNKQEKVLSSCQFSGSPTEAEFSPKLQNCFMQKQYNIQNK